MPISRLHISYNWAEENQNGLVDLLESECQNYSFKLERDQNLVQPGDHFFSLARQIAHAAKTVVLLSENYLLNSKWCVLELNELVNKSTHNFNWWVVNSQDFSLDDFLQDPQKRDQLMHRCKAINNQYADNQTDDKGRIVPVIDYHGILKQLNAIQDTMQDPPMVQIKSKGDWQNFLSSLQGPNSQTNEFHGYDHRQRESGLRKLFRDLDSRCAKHFDLKFSELLESRLIEYDSNHNPQDRGVSQTTLCGRICRSHPETYLGVLREVYLPTLSDYVSSQTTKIEKERLKSFTFKLFFAAVKMEWINECSAAFKSHKLDKIDFDVPEPAAIRFLMAALSGDSIELKLVDEDGLPTLTDPNVPDTAKVFEDNDTDTATLNLLISVCKAIGYTGEINQIWKTKEWEDNPDAQKFWLDKINLRLSHRRKMPNAVILPIGPSMDPSITSRARKTLPDLQLVTLTDGNGERSLIMRQSTVMTCMAECISVIETA